MIAPSELLTWRELLTTAWHHVKETRESLLSKTASFVMIGAVIQTALALFYALFFLAPVMQSGDMHSLSGSGDLSTYYFILKSIGGALDFFLGIVLSLMIWDSIEKTQNQAHSIITRAAHLFVPAAIAYVLASLTIGVGIILLVVPALFFSVWYFFVDNAVRFDGKTGVDALRFSHSLVRGRFWPAAGRIGAIAITSLLLMFAALTLSLVISRIIFFIASLLLPSISIAILGAVSEFIFFTLAEYAMLFGSLMGMFLYRNLKETLSLPQKV
ncbi:MAG: hypothetical protein Q7S47_00150 [bacterium]|nr:hypothetical protein [bacterium]